MERLEILMVEDNRGDVVLLDEALVHIGASHHTSVASDGVEAVSFLRQEGPYAQAPRPDVIVLDLKLPRMGGREVLEAILPDPNLCDIPVVVLSSSQSELDTLRSGPSAPGLCISKPSTFAGYIDIARTIISRGRLTENSPTLAP